MIGGAELEPESGMYNPHAFDVPTIHAAISERTRLAAEHRNKANDPGFLQQDAARRNQHNEAYLAGIKCKKHEQELGQTDGGFGPQPPAPADCPNCKRAQTRHRNGPQSVVLVDGHPGGRTRNRYDGSTPQDVAADHHGFADHYERSVAALKQHLRSRTAGLN